MTARAKKKARDEPPLRDQPLHDKLGDLLIAKGYAPNEFILNLNRSLQVPTGMELPDPWNLPSRLFRFPIETQVDDKARIRRIGLMHPLLDRHPFVKEVAEAIRPFKLDPKGAPNAYGYTRAPGTWWHAVDLIGRWEDLMRTRRFTTKHDIVRAVIFGLDYLDRLSTVAARAILTELKVKQPRSRGATLRLLSEPHGNKGESKKAGITWPLNSAGRKAFDDTEGTAWGRIYGIEAGWFTYRNRAGKGFLQWSEAGRAAFNGTSSEQFSLDF